VASEYDALRGQVVALRRGMSPFEATVDDLWARTRALDLAAVRTRVKLDNAERSELSLVKKKLAEEIRIAASLAAEIESTDGGASGLATRITQAGFSLLEDELFSTIMEADRGIVDVYWLRKTQVADEMSRLAKERGLRLQELDARFEVIRRMMEE